MSNRLWRIFASLWVAAAACVLLDYWSEGARLDRLAKDQIRVVRESSATMSHVRERNRR